MNNTKRFCLNPNILKSYVEENGAILFPPDMEHVYITNDVGRKIIDAFSSPMALEDAIVVIKNMLNLKKIKKILAKI